jgi:hypothetical protein
MGDGIENVQINKNGDVWTTILMKESLAILSEQVGYFALIIKG